MWAVGLVHVALILASQDVNKIYNVGQATAHLRPAFREVVGVDPSLGMLEKARASFASDRSINHETGDSSKYTFVQGSGEDLSKAIPADGSVDLIIAGTYGLPKIYQL